MLFTNVSSKFSWEIDKGRFSKVNLLLENLSEVKFFNKQIQTGKTSKLLSSNHNVFNVTICPNYKINYS